MLRAHPPAELPDVRTGCGVASVRRAATSGGGQQAPVALVTEAGEALEFDAVVFATHSDVTLRILGEDASPAERQVLEAIPYNDNEVYLHTGESQSSFRSLLDRAVDIAPLHPRPKEELFTRVARRPVATQTRR